MAYGVDASRYRRTSARSRTNISAPLVKTIMTRCIQCTRCIRFATEVAGVPELGAIGRGEDMEITTYLEQAMTSELQGNVVDLCPVGALTSKPYAFAARPWELDKTQSIDVMDALGSAIRIDTRGREVMRILPRTNDDVNEEWISDKTRHVVDGLRTQRLDQPYMRVNGRLRPATWKRSLRGHRRQGEGDAGRSASARSPGDLAARRGDVRAQGADGARSASHEYRRALCRLAARIRNTAAPAICSIRPSPASSEADAIMLIGANPRREAAVLNARIRKRWRKGNVPIGAGRREGRSDLSLQLSRRRAGKPGAIRRARAGLQEAKSRCSSSAQGALKRPDGAAVLAMAAKAAAIARRRSRTAGTASISCTREASLRRRARYRLRAGRGRPGHRRACSRPGALDVLFLLGVDEVEVAGRRLRRLYRHPWRPRRAPRRRHPAGRRLSGKIRHLRQHRRPRADGEPRRVPARRCARGLGDFARAVGRARPHAAVSTRSAHLRQALFAAHPHLMRIDQIAPGDAADIDKLAKLGGSVDKAPFTLGGARFLSDQSDRARLRHHGRMFGAGRMRAAKTAAE